jgi:hypothetical protein
MKDLKKNIAVQIAIKLEDKYLLKQIVARKISDDPDNNYSIASLCKEIIHQYLSKHSKPNNHKNNVFKLSVSNDAPDEHDDFV